MGRTADPLQGRRVAPAPAPTDCAGAGPTPVSLPSYSTVPAVGAFPFWLRPDLAIDPAAGVWRVKALRRGPGGWYVGWKWLPDARGAPASVSIEDLSSGRPVSIIVRGDEPKTGPRLDEHNGDGNDPEHGWSSRVFPGAGCYRVDVRWPNGGTSIGFAFGR